MLIKVVFGALRWCKSVKSPKHQNTSVGTISISEESYIDVLLMAFHFFCWQVTGKCGSVLVRLIPAPRGTGIVSAPVPKKLLTMAGIEDCYTSATGQTATLGNFGELTW